MYVQWSHFVLKRSEDIGAWMKNIFKQNKDEFSIFRQNAH